jgi:peptide deformylase
MRVFPDPILRQRARKVTQFDAKLAELAADMVETMEARQGVGLAANQVGVLQRMCVVKLPEWEEALVLVNPEIMRREGEREVEEGCLSLPGYRGMVNRSVRIRVRYQEVSGRQARLNADCMLAQAIEHETDHLNGILYIDHLIAHDQFFRIKVNDEGEVEYLPTGEPDAAELEAAAWRMNNRPNIPQFDPTNGRPATGAPQADTAGAGTPAD